MRVVDAVETAYKNGYARGYRDAMAEAARIIRDEIIKPQEEITNHDETGIDDNN